MPWILESMWDHAGSDDRDGHSRVETVTESQRCCCFSPAIAGALLTLDHGLRISKTLGFRSLGIASRGAANSKTDDNSAPGVQCLTHLPPRPSPLPLNISIRAGRPIGARFYFPDVMASCAWAWRQEVCAYPLLGPGPLCLCRWGSRWDGRAAQRLQDVERLGVRVLCTFAKCLGFFLSRHGGQLAATQ